MTIDNRPGDETLRLIDWLLDDEVEMIAHLNGLVVEDAGVEGVREHRRIEYGTGFGFSKDLEYVRALVIVAQRHLPSTLGT